MTKDIIRRCVFRPYRKGMGPTFTLTMWDCHRLQQGGPQSKIGYSLTAKHDDGKRYRIFEGEDYGCSPLYAIDSDDCVFALMGYLTLRPGDTYREHFDGYTDLQREFCDNFAESLSACVDARFCDENGNVKESK